MPFIGALSDFSTHVLTRSEVTQRDGRMEMRVTDRRLMKAIADYHEAYTAGRLLCVPFTSVVDYLHFLRIVCQAINGHGERAMLFLAAAVSDFYIPTTEMVCAALSGRGAAARKPTPHSPTPTPSQPEHKIQSSDGAIRIRLRQVPKMLGLVRKEWAPTALCIGFKLETDADMLMAKARESIQRCEEALSLRSAAPSLTPSAPPHSPLAPREAGTTCTAWWPTC